jgi:hypothetical protein
MCAFTKLDESSQANHGLHFPNVEAKISGVSMPEVMRSSPMCEENQAQSENCHEEKVLSDHDPLLLLFLFDQSQDATLRWRAMCHKGHLSMTGVTNEGRLERGPAILVAQALLPVRFCERLRTRYLQLRLTTAHRSAAADACAT